jgi:hypothetical protein
VNSDILRSQRLGAKEWLGEIVSARVSRDIASVLKLKLVIMHIKDWYIKYIKEMLPNKIWLLISSIAISS